MVFFNNLLTQKWLFAILFISLLTSCSVKSDSETEKKLFGSWVAEMKDSEEGVTMKMRETDTYNDDNTYYAYIKCYMTYPETMHMFNVSYSGTWKASKNEIETVIDKNSIDFSNFNYLLDSEDRTEMKEYILSEFKNQGYKEVVKIISLESESLTINDGDSDITFTRCYD